MYQVAHNLGIPDEVCGFRVFFDNSFLKKIEKKQSSLSLRNKQHIIVFMKDDIANSPSNPRKGIIINEPGGPDVYHGLFLKGQKMQKTKNEN